MDSATLQQLLGGLSSLGGLGLSAANQQNNYGVLQNALQTIGPTALQGYGLTGPGGSNSSYNGTGGANIDLGSLNGAFGNLGSAATQGSSAYSPQLLQQLTQGAQGQLPGMTDALTAAQGQNSQYQGLGLNLANSAGSTYNSVYNNTLSSLQAQQQPGVQQQAFGLQNTLFGRGVLDTTGAGSGAIAAGNFGSQVNAMNAQNSLSAQIQALQAQTAETQNASTLAGTGNSILSNAFNNFGNTNQLISGLNTAQLNNSNSAIQGATGLNTMGLNNLQSALGVGTQQATARNQSLFPYASTATALAGTQNAQGILANGLSTAGSSMLGTTGLSGLLSSLLGGGSTGNGSGTTGSGGSLASFLGSAGSGLSSLFSGSGSNSNQLSSLFSGAGLTSNGTSNNSNFLFNQGGYDPTTGFSSSGGSSDFSNPFGGTSSTPQYDFGTGFNGTGFNGAGGQATTPAVQQQQAGPSLGQNAGAGLGIIGGLASGSSTGQAGAGLSAAQLAAKNNIFGANGAGINAAAGQGLDALGIYSGLKQGGVAGDLGAAASAAKLGASLNAFGGASGAVATGAGYVAAPLALYNFGKNWQSGATGSDALGGAEAGASIGSIIPGVGTLVGGLVGGAVGALSSIAGGGKQDPETQMTYGANAAGANALQGQSPATSFQYLAGVMDAKNNTAGHSTALEQAFGRMGEGGVLSGMTTAINGSLSSGQVSMLPNGGVAFKTGGGTVTYPSIDAAKNQMMSDVVQPWLTQQGVSASSLTFKDAKGNSSGNNLQDAFSNLISQYMSGGLTSQTAIGKQGQKASIPNFAG